MNIFIVFYCLGALISLIRNLFNGFQKGDSISQKISLTLFRVGHSILWIPLTLSDLFILGVKPKEFRERTAKLTLRWSFHLFLFAFLTLIFLLILVWITFNHPSLQNVGIMMIIMEIGLLSYGLSHVFGGKEIIDKLKNSRGNIYISFFVFTLLFGFNFILIISYNDRFFFNVVDFTNAETFIGFVKQVINYSYNDLISLASEGNLVLSDYLRVLIGILFGLITILDFSFITRLKRSDENKLELAYNNYLIGNNERSQFWLHKIKDPKNTKSYDRVNAYLNLQTDFDKALIYAENTLAYADVRNEETIYLRLYTIVMNLGKEDEKTAYIELFKEELPNSIYVIIIEMLNMARFNFETSFKSLQNKYQFLLKKRNVDNADPFFDIYLTSCKLIDDIGEVLKFQTIVIKTFAVERSAKAIYRKYGGDISRSQFLKHLKSLTDFDLLTSRNQKQFKKNWKLLLNSSKTFSDNLDFESSLVSPLHQTFLKKILENVLSEIDQLRDTRLFKESVANEENQEDFLYKLRDSIILKKDKLERADF